MEATKEGCDICNLNMAVNSTIRQLSTPSPALNLSLLPAAPIFLFIPCFIRGFSHPDSFLLAQPLQSGPFMLINSTLAKHVVKRLEADSSPPFPTGRKLMRRDRTVPSVCKWWPKPPPLACKQPQLKQRTFFPGLQTYFHRSWLQAQGAGSRREEASEFQARLFRVGWGETAPLPFGDLCTSLVYCSVLCTGGGKALRS